MILFHELVRFQRSDPSILKYGSSMFNGVLGGRCPPLKPSDLKKKQSAILLVRFRPSPLTQYM